MNKGLRFAAYSLLCIFVIFGLRYTAIKSLQKASDETGGTNSETAQKILNQNSLPQETANTSKVKLTEEELQKANEAKDIVIKKTISKTQRGDILFFRTVEFDLVYFSKEDEYLISVLTPNFETARKKAETAFLDTLNLNPEIACKLTIYVSTPATINADIGGKIFKLSFCQ